MLIKWHFGELETKSQPNSRNFLNFQLACYPALVEKHFEIPDGASVKMFSNVNKANYESHSGFLKAEGKDNTACLHNARGGYPV